jgi:hypothetical protein
VDFAFTFAQVNTANLSGNRLRELKEFEATNTLVRRQAIATMLQNLFSSFGSWLPTWG